jgi:hypothetical protein
MIACILDKLADTHPRLAVALVFGFAVAGCFVVAAVVWLGLVAAAALIYSLGA